MDLGAREKMYFYIKENGPMARNMIEVFQIKNQECREELKSLIDDGYVIEKDGLFAVTGKNFEG